MLLVIDIGNSNLVFGLFDGARLQHSWRAATRKESTAEEYALVLDGFFRLAGLSQKAVNAIVICSVVPPLDDRFETLARRYFNIEPLFIQPVPQKLMPIHYRPPADVGADRIVNSVAAYQLYGGPVVVLDFGTATTFDVVSQEGEYLGGIICPGIGISAEALSARASKLPRIDIRKPDELVGSSTVASMQSGIYHGYIGLVEGIIRRLRAQVRPAHVVATGGLAPLIGSGCEGIDEINEDLTLHGLKICYERLRA